MSIPRLPPTRPRVCAVSYLNTVPLVWGLLRDPAQRGIFDLGFEVPSVCADQLASGASDIGIVPLIEIARQGLDYFRGCGIASDGAVRSILLVSKVPLRNVRVLATDSGSRTSVMLARIILADKFGCEPRLVTHAPNLQAMLEIADAALLIGDAALRVDPQAVPFETLDLGEEWTSLTGLPMVFAVWAGHTRHIHEPFGKAFLDSCRYGVAHVEDIVREESQRRGFPETLVRQYLTRHIRFELSDPHHAAIDTFLRRAAALDRAAVAGGVPA